MSAPKNSRTGVLSQGDAYFPRQLGAENVVSMLKVLLKFCGTQRLRPLGHPTCPSLRSKQQHLSSALNTRLFSDCTASAASMQNHTKALPLNHHLSRRTPFPATSSFSQSSPSLRSAASAASSTLAQVRRSGIHFDEKRAYRTLVHAAQSDSSRFSFLNRTFPFINLARFPLSLIPATRYSDPVLARGVRFANEPPALNERTQPNAFRNANRRLRMA
jgi:hypothetical protein